MFRIVVPYRDRPKASIVVARIEEPYGEGSGPVLSIGSTLKGDVDNPTWKVHIPCDIVEEVLSAAREINNPDWKNRVE
jgi:hypothetical protein